MDSIKELFEYQRFAQNARLQSIIDDVCARYMSGSEELDDVSLDVSAAGDVDELRNRHDPLERSAYDPEHS